MNKITYIKLQKLLPYYNKEIQGWKLYFNDNKTLQAERSDGMRVVIGMSVAYDLERIKERLEAFAN